MRKYLRSSVAALLALAILLTSYIPVFAVGGQPSSYSSSSNSGQRDVVCTTLDGTSADEYYTGSYTFEVLSEQSASALLNSLRTLMKSTHTYTSSYDDCHYKADKTDCENNNGKVSLIYTSYSATQSQWNGWNREHVWPQSLGGGNTKGGGADLHHVRPSDAVVNSTRGNKKYGYANGGKNVYGSNPASGCLGGAYAGNYFEPLDNVKGDVARIVLYVYVRWGSEWGADSVTEVFQSVDVLLEWCELDPVDTWEMGRNEVVEDIQGNRNVFIDYPEYAWLLFGYDVPDDMTTPSGEASGGVSSGNQGSGNQGGNQGSGDQGGTETCKHSTTTVKNATEATCVSDGYTGDTYCTSCNELISRGTKIPASSAHQYSKWTQNEDGSYTCECSVCGETQIMTVDSIIVSSENDAEKILMLLLLGITDMELLDALSN